MESWGVGVSAGKHTAGPWFTFANGTCVGGPVGILGNPSGADTAGIAHCGMALRTGDELQANARLIAAAPELLDELQKAHRLLQIALKHMGGERQSLFAAESEREGLGTEGATRHHERAAVLAKATGAEADPQPIPVGEAQDSDFGAFQAAAS